MRSAGRFSWIVNLHSKLPNPTLEVKFCTGQNTNAVQRRKGFQAREIDQKSKGPSFRKVANVFNAQQKVNINIG